jgi:hypothetical protein
MSVHAFLPTNEWTEQNGGKSRAWKEHMMGCFQAATTGHNFYNKKSTKENLIHVNWRCKEFLQYQLCWNQVGTDTIFTSNI